MRQSLASAQMFKLVSMGSSKLLFELSLHTSQPCLPSAPCFIHHPCLDPCTAFLQQPPQIGLPPSLMIQLKS